jgi:transcriptional regulator with PAS, ATPase and Fis domain
LLSHRAIHKAGKQSEVTNVSTSAANLDLLNNGDAQVSRAIKQVKQALNHPIPILIQGETGVGKDLFAKAIHDASPRKNGPWVAVNCAALPEGLIEAELFGYEEGAFTGARRKGSAGKLVQAHGGTLFLDEIGDMPLSLQARLLRVLQDRNVTPLGSTQSIQVDFSLISATNQKLKEKVERGEFRSDLYYRLNGLSVQLPALRARTDLTALIQIILQIEQSSHVQVGKEVMALFAAHPWPGNIRQLHNVIRTAIALSDGELLTMDCLTQDFLDEMQSSTAIKARDTLPEIETSSLTEITAEAIQRAMQKHHGNISAVARTMGMSRNTLYRKLKTLGLV